MDEQFELRAWLGPALDDMTDDQVEQFTEMVAAIDQRYPITDPDDAPFVIETRTYAMSGALALLLGDDTLTSTHQQWERAKQAEREAMATLTGAIIASAHQGSSELDMANRTGLSRGTVRKALGK